MALPASGAISMSQVAVELGLPANTNLSLNDSRVRNLAGKPSGIISMSDLHGKSSATWHTATYTFVPGRKERNNVDGSGGWYGFESGLTGAGRMVSQSSGAPDIRYIITKDNNNNLLEVGMTAWVHSNDKYISFPGFYSEYHLTVPLGSLTISGIWTMFKSAYEGSNERTAVLRWYA